MEIEKIPLNIFINIGCFLPISSILNLGLTCKKISKILTNEFLWKQISNKENGDLQEKPIEFKTWKEFVKEGNFKWEIVEKNKELLRLSKNDKEIQNYEDKIHSFVSKNSTKREGKYTFKLIVNCKNQGCFCIGIANNSFISWTNYMCNSKNARGITGNGFIGSSDSKYGKGENYCKVRFGDGYNSKTETLFLVVDLNKKGFEIWNENKPEDIHRTDISDLLTNKEGIKLAATLNTKGESIEILNTKWEK